MKILRVKTMPRKAKTYKTVDCKIVCASKSSPYKPSVVSPKVVASKIVSPKKESPAKKSSPYKPSVVSPKVSAVKSPKKASPYKPSVVASKIVSPMKASPKKASPFVDRSSRYKYGVPMTNEIKRLLPRSPKRVPFRMVASPRKSCQQRDYQQPSSPLRYAPMNVEFRC